MRIWVSAVCMMLGSSAWGQSTYVVPVEDQAVLQGVEFFAAQNLGALHDRYAECDKTNICDGRTLKSPSQCSADPSRNTAILKMPSGALFYDARLAVDGSASSKRRRGGDKAEAAFRYPAAPHASVDAAKVPYVVLPPEFFAAKYADLRTGVKVQVGDIAAVVHAGKVSYALVTGAGLACRVGEGSGKLSEDLGSGSAAVSAPVLFFIFPDSARLIGAGLSPANVNARLAERGSKLMQELKGSH